MAVMAPGDGYIIQYKTEHHCANFAWHGMDRWPYLSALTATCTQDKAQGCRGVHGPEGFKARLPAWASNAACMNNVLSSMSTASAKGQQEMAELPDWPPQRV
jgi:hypothetical protein